jgi:hypothetical protein
MDELVQFEIEKPVVAVFKRFDRSEVDRIAEILSDRLVTRLWDVNGRLEFLEDDGRMVPVTYVIVQMFVRKHFRTPQLAWRGGKGEVSLAEMSIERQSVADVMRALLLRAAKAPVAEKALSYQQWDEINIRLRSGESVQSIAGAYALPPAKVQEIRDGQRE